MIKKIIFLLFISSSILGQQTITNRDFQFSGYLRDTLGKTYCVDSLTNTTTIDYEIINYTRSNDLGDLDCQTDSNAAIVLFQTDTVYLNVFWSLSNYNVADTLLTKRSEAEYNDLGKVVKPYRIERFAHHSAPTADVNNYYDFQVASTGVIYVPDDYATIPAAYTASSIGDSIYVKTHSETITDFISANGRTLIGVGDVKITNNSSNGYIFLAGNSTTSVKGIELEQASNKYVMLGNGGNSSLENLYFDNCQRLFNSIGTDGTIIFRKCNMKYLATAYFGITNNAQACIVEDCNIYNKSTVLVDAKNAGGYVSIKNNRIKGNTTSVVYLQADKDSINIQANRYDTVNYVVRQSAVTHNAKAVNVLADSGYVNSFYATNTDVDTVTNWDIQNINLNSVSELFTFRITNGNLNYENNSVTKANAGVIVMRSDSIVTANIKHSDFHLSDEAAGISVGDSVYNNEITTYFDTNLVSLTAGTNVHGLQIYNMKNSFIRGNTAINTSLIMKGNNHDCKGAVMTGNLGINAQLFVKGCDSILINKNTLYNSNSIFGCVRIRDNTDAFPSHGTIVRDNILYHINTGSTGACIYIESTDFQNGDVTLDSDYNILYSLTSTVITAGTSLYTFEEWQGFGQDLNSSKLSPQFVDAPADFRIYSTSPANNSASDGENMGAFESVEVEECECYGILGNGFLKNL